MVSLRVGYITADLDLPQVCPFVRLTFPFTERNREELFLFSYPSLRDGTENKVFTFLFSENSHKKRHVLGVVAKVIIHSQNLILINTKHNEFQARKTTIASFSSYLIALTKL